MEKIKKELSIKIIALVIISYFLFITESWADDSLRPQVGQSYNRIVDIIQNKTMPNKMTSRILDILPNNSHILSLGCGQADDEILFANNGHRVLATDLSAKMIDSVKARIEREKIANISTDVLDLTKTLPFDDDSFDVVYSRLTLHYFTNTQIKALVSEIKRILKPSGKAVIIVKSDEDYYAVTAKDKGLQIDEEGMIVVEAEDGTYKRNFLNEATLRELFKNFNVELIDPYKERLMRTVGDFKEPDKHDSSLLLMVAKSLKPSTALKYQYEGFKEEKDKELVNRLSGDNTGEIDNALAELDKIAEFDYDRVARVVEKVFAGRGLRLKIESNWINIINIENNEVVGYRTFDNWSPGRGVNSLLFSYAEIYDEYSDLRGKRLFPLMYRWMPAQPEFFKYSGAEIVSGTAVNGSAARAIWRSGFKDIKIRQIFADRDIEHIDEIKDGEVYKVSARFPSIDNDLKTTKPLLPQTEQKKTLKGDSFIETVKYLLEDENILPTYEGSTRYFVGLDTKAHAVLLDFFINELKNLPFNNELGLTILFGKSGIEARGVVNRLIDYMVKRSDAYNTEKKWDDEEVKEIADIFKDLEIFKNEIHSSMGIEGICYSLDLSIRDDRPLSIILERYMVTQDPLTVARAGTIAFYVYSGTISVDIYQEPNLNVHGSGIKDMAEFFPKNEIRASN